MIRNLNEANENTNIPKNDQAVVKGISSTNNYSNPDYAFLEQPMIRVMESYQNANRWLDTIKESVLIDMGCPFFSDFIHGLAHMMPGRFDKFGDILHTRHLLVNYPATKELVNVPKDPYEVFVKITSIYDDITDALNEFIKVTTDTKLHYMANEAENLLMDLNDDLLAVGTIYKMLDSNSNLATFDQWVRKYLEEKSKLL